MKKTLLSLLVIGSLLAVSCVSKATKTTPEAPGTKPPVVEKIIATDAGKILTVQVKSENVREFPNGPKLGKMYKGEQIKVLKRVGNWVEFTHEDFDKAYIWAPSVGYAYTNLYSPFFYYDTTKQSFRDVAYFQNFFSERGQRRQEINSSYELFFKNIGLGSHESTILDLVSASQQVVEHGITLFVDKQNNRVRKVRVDYLRLVKGYPKALKKSGLPVKKPGHKDGGHLTWEAGELLPNLIVDLERKEWNSNFFASIWYILPEGE